jgi:hypothetical protein
MGYHTLTARGLLVPMIGEACHLAHGRVVTDNSEKNDTDKSSFRSITKLIISDNLCERKRTFGA